MTAISKRIYAAQDLRLFGELLEDLLDENGKPVACLFYFTIFIFNSSLTIKGLHKVIDIKLSPGISLDSVARNLFSVISSVLLTSRLFAFEITSSSKRLNCRKNKSNIRGELCV